MTVDRTKSLPPLTVGGKFKLAAKGAFDPDEFILIGVACRRRPDYTDPKSLGQGLGSFGERYALNFADQTIGIVYDRRDFSFHISPGPSLLRKGRVASGAARDMPSRVVIRHDSGTRQFNSSEFVGNGVAAGIANAYHPHDERSLTGTAATWGTDIAVDTLAMCSKSSGQTSRRSFTGNRFLIRRIP